MTMTTHSHKAWTDKGGHVKATYGQRQKGCVLFALKGSGRVLLENVLALCITDVSAVSEGHSLVIPRRHLANGMTLHQPMWNAVVELMKLRSEKHDSPDATISNWNMGLHSREAAGKSLVHAHWQQLPLRARDFEKEWVSVRRLPSGLWLQAGNFTAGQVVGQFFSQKPAWPSVKRCKAKRKKAQALNNPGRDPKK